MPRQVFKMHLALAIGGCTLQELDQRMSEAEFHLWLRYAQQFFLPERRAELQAAQTALLIAVTMGGSKRMKLSDYLILPPTSEDEQTTMDSETGGEIIGALGSAKVYRLGQGRKNDG